jgi:hypothetical protein
MLSVARQVPSQKADRELIREHICPKDSPHGSVTLGNTRRSSSRIGSHSPTARIYS